MNCVDPGHVYYLQTYPASRKRTWDFPDVRLGFFKKIGENFPGNVGIPADGTNCQEVLRALINRCLYLNKQIPCPQTIRVIENLRNALYLFEYRAAERKDKLVDLFRMETLRSDLVGIEELPACNICGHIFPHQH